MKLMSGTGLLYLRKIREMYRRPMSIVKSLVIPAVWLSILFIIYQGHKASLAYVEGEYASGSMSAEDLTNVSEAFRLAYNQAISLCVARLPIFFACYSNVFVGAVITSELSSGVIERFCVTPVSRFALLLGPVLCNVTANLVHTILFVLGSYWIFGFRTSLVGLALLLTLMSLLVTTISAFSNAVGLITKQVNKFMPIMRFILFLMTMLLLAPILIPALMPNSLDSPWLTIIFSKNPLLLLSNIASCLVMEEILTTNVGYTFLIMISLTLVTLYWATKAFAKAVM